MNNPYEKSTTRDSDVTQSEWPLVTKNMLARALIRYTVDVKELDPDARPDVESLLLARVWLSNFKLRLMQAVRSNLENEKVRVRLELLVSELEQMERSFPLQVGKP
jgi:hypothetical protein